MSPSLLGDGYLEAINSRDIEQKAQQQRQVNLGIEGEAVGAPVLEASRPAITRQVGRFGWKSQHSSLMSSCADSLRNELGIRNRLYPDEYPTHAASDSPTPFDTPDAKTHKTELERLVAEIRQTSPPARDTDLAASSDAQAGEKLFAQIGCAVCHVATYKTVKPGTRINGGTYKVPKFLGNQVIHPYSDFLLHDVGTGDGIPQAAKPEYLDQSTAN
ncbi:MAG: di-heme oxidoredictase family protein, partial [Terriglobales bacterium]